MSQEYIDFDKPREADLRIEEFGRFAKQIGPKLLDQFWEIMTNAQAGAQLFRERKNPVRAMASLIINTHYMNDFRSEWPDITDERIMELALECFDKVFSHAEYLKTLDPNYLSWVAKKMTRKEAIARGDISGKFPTNFVPPLSRRAVHASSDADDTYVERVQILMIAAARKPSYLQNLRGKAAEAAEMLREKEPELDLKWS